MKLFIVFTLFIFGTSAFIAQDTKNTTETFQVRGNCGMCKDRIEEAVDVVGVKRASWDEKTETLTISFNSSKITLDEIHRIIAKIGHTTSIYKADPKAYENLHHCCKYVEHNHTNDHKH
jgi:copper chaperone CopZ